MLPRGAGLALTLVRHTATAASGTCYGISEVPLAASFPAEAAAVIDRLAQPARLVTSPAARCRTLAGLMADRWGLTPVVDPLWREMDFGRWEGVPWDAVPRAEIDAWLGNLVDARPHGGESVAMLRDRVRAAMAAVREETLVVTHAGPIRAALVLSGDPDGWQADVAYGGLFRF